MRARPRVQLELPGTAPVAPWGRCDGCGALLPLRAVVLWLRAPGELWLRPPGGAWSLGEGDSLSVYCGACAGPSWDAAVRSAKRSRWTVRPSRSVLVRLASLRALGAV